MKILMAIVLSTGMTLSCGVHASAGAGGSAAEAGAGIYALSKRVHNSHEAFMAVSRETPAKIKINLLTDCFEAVIAYINSLLKLKGLSVDSIDPNIPELFEYQKRICAFETINTALDNLDGVSNDSPVWDVKLSTMAHAFNNFSASFNALVQRLEQPISKRSFPPHITSLLKEYNSIGFPSEIFPSHHVSAEWPIADLDFLAQGAKSLDQKLEIANRLIRAFYDDFTKPSLTPAPGIAPELHASVLTEIERLRGENSRLTAQIEELE